MDEATPPLHGASISAPPRLSCGGEASRRGPAMRGRRPTMIGHAMADAPDDAGAAPGPGAPGYLRHVCHELRQPLVVAAGYVAMLDDGSFGELAAEVHAILRTVAERLDAANAIIDDLASAANSAAAAPGQT